MRTDARTMPEGTQVIILRHNNDNEVTHAYAKFGGGFLQEYDEDSWKVTNFGSGYLEHCFGYYITDPNLNIPKFKNYKGCAVTYTLGVGLIAYTLPDEVQPNAQNRPSKDASTLCLRASELLAERGKQYDGSGKERSMPSTVAAFNAVYGTSLTEQQGWHFMILLKMARQRTGGHIDSAEDLIAYAALAAENTHLSLA